MNQGSEAGSLTAPALPEADAASIRWRVNQLREGRHLGGVVAIAARPVWNGPPVIELDDGSQVAIRLGTSVLAIRDAISARDDFTWVVVLTDRSSAELPTGVLDHLQPAFRLVDLDAWQPLLSLFRANRREFSLLSKPGGGSSSQLARAALRELAIASDPDNKPRPAPGGVLTNDHLFTALADRAFGLGPDVSAHQVALWSMDPARAGRFPAWIASADTELAEQLLIWLENKLGPLGAVIMAVLRDAGPGELVPLGLVAALLDDTAAAAAVFPASSAALIRTRTLLEVRLGGRQLTEQQLINWGNVATLAVSDGPLSDAVLRRTETLVTELGASDLIGRSEVLPAALEPRLRRLAEALAVAVDSPTEAQRSAVEAAWADVLAHRECRADSPSARRDVQVAGAALRLWRWSRSPSNPPAGLAEWINDYRHELSWVDAAVNDAFTGAVDEVLARVGDAIVTAVRARRAEQDRMFARLLASAGAHRVRGASAPLYIEDVLDRIVAPLSASQPSAFGEESRTPVLLIVADGMSASVSNEVVADAVWQHRPQWQECRLIEEDATAALAALPTVTEFSRCSLLSGSLQRGTAPQEQRGFSQWLTSRGMTPPGQVLFHKADLDAVSRGSALASDVRTAIDDTKHRPVVACVLNDIDNALDRSDPIGTTWTLGSFKHLDPLLSAAASVGRTIVLLSDHGHVPERREQPSVQRGQQISARYRLADGVEVSTLPTDEILVDGPRVLTEGNRAVLAVDEQLRYTGMKAGYHGGATPAEAVIPISILVNGAAPTGLGLEPVESTVPAWWNPPPVMVEPAQSSVKTGPQTRAPKKAVSPTPDAPTLFDPDTPRVPSPNADDGVAKLLRSSLFAQQYQIYGRNLHKRQLAALLREAIAAGGVLALGSAAQLLGVKATRVSGALSVLAQVLNTDGVEVLTVSGSDVQLRAALMFEQFGVAEADTHR
jgi:hypothetical protein